MPVPISGPITSDLAEFLNLWDELDKSARCELLAVARRLTQAVTERSS
jgi:3-methyladenine DNA glycosylase AlkD